MLRNVPVQLQMILGSVFIVFLMMLMDYISR